MRGEAVRLRPTDKHKDRRTDKERYRQTHKETDKHKSGLMMEEEGGEASTPGAEVSWWLVMGGG